MSNLKIALYLSAATACLSGCSALGASAHTANYHAPTYTPPNNNQLWVNYRPQMNQARVYQANYQTNQYAVQPQFMRASFRPQTNYQTQSQFNSGFPFRQMAEPADAPARRALMAQAHQALGVRYKYGGNSPGEGFDCSGLTSYIYKNGNGISLPRTAAEQSRASRTINFEQMRPGDLIFFRTSGSAVNHVGIYVGRGEFIHAASGGGKVSIDTLSKTYWQQRLVKFGTFLA